MNACPHCKSPAARAVSTVVPNTSAEAQELWMLEELRKAGPAGCTTDDFRSGGVYQVSARIFGLRAQGFTITTELYDGLGTDNVYHFRMARYRLVAEPLGLEPKKRRKAGKSGAGEANGGEVVQ